MVDTNEQRADTAPDRTRPLSGGTDDERRSLAGDNFLADAHAQITESIVIAASPAAIWPWLVQMGADRAGFYALDLFDPARVQSAREVHPEWQDLREGTRILASRGTGEGFDVLTLDPERALVLGGLYDPAEGVQLDFFVRRPRHFWHASWAFVLEPIAPDRTVLWVRARVAFSREEQRHAVWVRPAHKLMERAQLRHLAERAEGRLPRDSRTDVLDGVAGALRIAFGLLTPFLRGPRSHHGLEPYLAERVYPGDERVPEPTWSYTHGVEIDAPVRDVWPWLLQLGRDRGGLYSYQWLENLVGCEIRNTETLHPEWALHAGDGLSLHPGQPPLPIVERVPERHLLAHAARDEAAFSAGKPWVEVSWLFYLEPRGDHGARLISRYRSACSSHLGARLAFGPALIEPVSHAMDMRMLRGIKERAERRAAG